MSEYFLIAKITSVSDKKGFVKIYSYSDFLERFYSLGEVYIDFFDTKKKFFVEEIKRVHDDFFIRFRNFNSDSETRIFLDKEIFVDKKGVIELPENYYFVHDLINSKIFRNEKYFGKITDVLFYPANDVYVIQDANGQEILLPALSGLIESFDAKNKVMILRPGESFYEDEN